MGNDIDYEAIDIPPDKAPAEYDYLERRAEILETIKRRGNPYGIKKIALADRYDVSPPTITKDFKRLATHIEANIGSEAKLTARTAMERAVQELQDDEQYAAAFQIAMQWNKWLQSIGEQERVAFEADITHREADGETDHYVLLEDDEADAVSAGGEMSEPPIPEQKSGGEDDGDD